MRVFLLRFETLALAGSGLDGLRQVTSLLCIMVHLQTDEGMCVKPGSDRKSTCSVASLALWLSLLSPPS